MREIRPYGSEEGVGRGETLPAPIATINERGWHARPVSASMSCANSHTKVSLTGGECGIASDKLGCRNSESMLAEAAQACYPAVPM